VAHPHIFESFDGGKFGRWRLFRLGDTKSDPEGATQDHDRSAAPDQELSESLAVGFLTTVPDRLFPPALTHPSSLARW
jgi:hypothetical protein